MTLELCSFCRERHSAHPNARLSPSPTGCFICRGLMGQLPKLTDEALAKAARAQWDSFLVQTTFPREVLLREESVFDGEPLESALAIKNQCNRIATDLISKKSGKPYDAQGQVALTLNFSTLSGKANPSNLYLFGHYVKKTRAYCQHDWACSACRGRGCRQCNFHKQNYPSIEGALRSVFAPAFGASDAHLHASGREDVDVMHLEGGRPFVLELVQPLKRTADLDALAAHLSSTYPLEVLGLHGCLPFWIENVCNSHFDKHYRAWIAGEKPLTPAHLSQVLMQVPLLISQQTPVRVMGRRSDLVRPRRVYEIKPVSVSENEWVLDIYAEAGTYIKELIHGDTGRTVPSISSIVGFPCQCKQLDVMGVEDFYVNTLKSKRE